MLQDDQESVAAVKKKAQVYRGREKEFVDFVANELSNHACHFEKEYSSMPIRMRKKFSNGLLPT